VPELPEVETARQLIADRAMRRGVVAVDDADTFECCPHAPSGTVGGRSAWWCSREQAAWPDAA
jgi:formamidopyrimidine-DNA glycosylase